MLHEERKYQCWKDKDSGGGVVYGGRILDWVVSSFLRGERMNACMHVRYAIWV